MIRSGIKLLSPLPYPSVERNLNDGMYHKVHQQSANTLSGQVLRYKDDIGVSDFKEHPDECITKIGLRDQESQLLLDCSSFCGSDESGAVLEVDVKSCLDTCFTKG